MPSPGLISSLLSALFPRFVLELGPKHVNQKGRSPLSDPALGVLCVPMRGGAYYALRILRGSGCEPDQATAK